MDVSTLASVRDFAARLGDDPAVRALLERSREVPRVGACSLEAPLAITLADAHSVHVTWPAIGVDVDIIFLVHDGPLDAKTRDRIAVGPAEFIVVRSVADISAAWESLDPDRLERARTRSLWYGLAALGYRPPALPTSLTREYSATVIGPEEADRQRVAQSLRAAGIVVDGSLGADVVVAVAPARGWESQDYPRLEAAFSHVGRMIVTAPLPRSVCGDVVVAPEREVAAMVRRQAQLPPLAPLPDACPAAWERCAHRLETKAGMARPALVDALVITIVVGVGLARVLPLSVALALSLVLGGLRLWRAHVSGMPLWRRSDVRARGIWLRRKIAGGGV